MSPDTEARPRLGVIDVGTNSTRLIVAEVEPGGSYGVLGEEREVTRLGEGLHRTGRLADAAVNRTLDAIGKMKAIADAFGVRELRIVATNAVREAENGRDFSRLVRRRHRVQVKVITAEEEARLAFRSVARRFDLEDEATAVVDIGGGSTEVVLARGSVIERVHSLPLGAVRLTEEFLPSDPIRPGEWKALERAIDRVIEREIGEPPFATPVMVGSGGTFVALAAMALHAREGRAASVRGSEMTRAEVERLLDRLRRIPMEDRKTVRGLSPDRADIIVAGAAVMARLAKRLRCRRILINDRGIRDGVLLSMIAELEEDAGDGTVGPQESAFGTEDRRTEAEMAKQLRCGDIMPDCEFTATAETEAELMQKAARHAAEAHGIEEVTPELAEKVKAAMRTV